MWILPVEGPGEACLLAGFLLSVGDLDWTGEGIVVSASVYVDREAAEAAAGTLTEDGPADPIDPIDTMAATAKRDKALADVDGSKLGGLDARTNRRKISTNFTTW